MNENEWMQEKREREKNKHEIIQAESYFSFILLTETENV